MHLTIESTNRRSTSDLYRVGYLLNVWGSGKWVVPDIIKLIKVMMLNGQTHCIAYLLGRWLIPMHGISPHSRGRSLSGDELAIDFLNSAIQIMGHIV